MVPRTASRKVALPFGEVAPRRGGGILKVGHVHVGAGIEAVDDHLAIDGAGDLDAAILQIGRDGGAFPRGGVVVRLRLAAAVGQLAVVGDEVGLTTGIELHAARGPGRQQSLAAVLELVT